MFLAVTESDKTVVMFPRETVEAERVNKQPEETSSAVTGTRAGIVTLLTEVGV
jgi:hypothetical protein